MAKSTTYAGPDVHKDTHTGLAAAGRRARAWKTPYACCLLAHPTYAPMAQKKRELITERTKGVLATVEERAMWLCGDRDIGRQPRAAAYARQETADEWPPAGPRARGAARYRLHEWRRPHRRLRRDGDLTHEGIRVTECAAAAGG